MKKIGCDAKFSKGFCHLLFLQRGILLFYDLHFPQMVLLHAFGETDYDGKRVQAGRYNGQQEVDDG